MNLRPYYIFRPSQLLQRNRVKRLLGNSAPNSIQVVLPWNLVIDVDLRDGIGATIASNGLWDLPVTETIFRLLDPGEIAIDVGANIGHMTGAMGICAGPRGRVLAFEPHPYVFSLLVRHCERWQSNQSVGLLEPRQIALGRAEGTATLFTNEQFEHNMGQAKLHALWGNASALAVSVERLDDVVGDMSVGVMKIDVEGMELEVLEGAPTLIQDRRVRDVIFEDHRKYPTPVTDFLESYGYLVALIHQTAVRPKLVDPTGDVRVIGDPSYLATTDPRRAFTRFRRFGWRSLRPRPRVPP